MKGWVRFTVPGKPAPKGSTRSFVSRTTGRVVTITDSVRLRDWTKQVAVAARAHKVTKAPKGASVALNVRFIRRRPSGKRLRYPTTRPDLDKLMRALLDALTGVAYDDDAQVCLVMADKAWGDEDGTAISIRWEA